MSELIESANGASTDVRLPVGVQCADVDRAPHNSRLRYIDALRAIAALLVVWLHVGESYVQLDPVGANGHWLYAFAQSIDVGRIGVVAFFLISGFVIPFSIRADRPAPISTFAIKRFLRIYPAYWLSVPLGVLTTYWLWGRHFSVGDFLVNLTLLQDFFGVQAAQGLYWTLLVELVFYVLCIGLLLTRSLHDMRRVCALAIAFGLVHALAMIAHWLGRPLMSSTTAFWCLNLSIMLCGTLYRTCVIEGRARRDPWLRFGFGGLLAFYLAVYPIATTWAVGFERNAAISYALGLLLFIAGTSGVRIATRVTDWLGQISYSVYLFHPVIFQPLLWWLLQQPTGSWWRTRHLGIYLLVNMLLTIAFASVVYRFVEKPCIDLGHRYSRKRAARKADRHVVVPVATQPAVATAAGGIGSRRKGDGGPGT